MKKKKDSKKRDNRMIILVIIIIALTSAFAFVIIGNNIKITISNKENNILLDEYYAKLKTLEDGMDEVSISNDEGSIEWFDYKNKKIDEKLLQTYNFLVDHIRWCYLYATDDGTNLSNSNYVNKLIQYDEIKQKEFKKLMQGYNWNNEGCLKQFEDYGYIMNDEEKFYDLRTKILNINSYYREIKNRVFNNFNDILVNENQKLDLMIELVELLKTGL